MLALSPRLAPAQTAHKALCMRYMFCQITHILLATGVVDLDFLAWMAGVVSQASRSAEAHSALRTTADTLTADIERQFKLSGIIVRSQFARFPCIQWPAIVPYSCRISTTPQYIPTVALRTFIFSLNLTKYMTDF